MLSFALNTTLYRGLVTYPTFTDGESEAGAIARLQAEVQACAEPLPDHLGAQTADQPGQ